MADSMQDASHERSIDLARSEDFDLGPLRVRPATCTVEWNGAPQILQRRVMQVLVVLARARGSVVSQAELVESCWRGMSVSEDAIYRCISKLRRLAADYPDAPFAIEAIPGVGYRLTSSGSADDEAAAKQAASPEGRLRFRPLVVATALLVLAILGAALWMIDGRAPDQRTLRVAVQPLEILSDSKEARLLARRIPNEVVDALGDSQIEAVLVGEPLEEKGPSSAGPALGLIVTGILRNDPHHAIVDVRIEDGASRAALWSTEFRRDSREASDLPLEVAARVADVVNMITFARRANPPLTDDTALTALLQISDTIRDANEGAWAPMIKNAQGLVARHPEFAFGHSVLAEAYLEAAQSVPDRARAMREAARAQADLALKLDPSDAGAYAVLSKLARPYNYRAEEAILLRGIRIARHPKEPLGALYSYEGTLLSNVGRLREALSFQLIAQATDKWGAPKTAKVARIYADVGNMPAARKWIAQAAQRWPNHTAVRQYRLSIAGFYESPRVARTILDEIAASASSDSATMGVWRRFIDARASPSPGTTADAVKAIMAAGDAGTISPEIEVMMLASLGQTKLAIGAANAALDLRQPLEPRFLFIPATSEIRRDPGFVNLAERLGLIDYWRGSGKRPDFCIDHRAEAECTAELRRALQ